ncbi:MAG: SMC-Scp complex subunit ScpB [Anaerolineae bacterium]
MNLPEAVEAVLFAAGEEVSVRALARAVAAPPQEIEQVLALLADEYESGSRGIRLQRAGEAVQMVAAPEAGRVVERYLGLQASGRLSAAAVETLAIVAYRQPVTRAQVEAVRGVDCSGVLRTLVGRGLLEEVGRLEQPGRPILYGTTFGFLQHFGLSDLGQLPPVDVPVGEHTA